MSLSYNYKVKEIYGIQFGYRGFYTHDWVQLFPQSIKAIHKLGGTTLGSSRGGFDLPKIIEALKKKGINHVQKIMFFSWFLNILLGLYYRRGWHSSGNKRTL